MPTVYLDNTPPGYKDQLRSAIRSAPRKARSCGADLFPIVRWLPKYNLEWLWSDLICAITIGTVVIPQSMAYAKMAGLPAQYGLYSSFIGVMIYPFIGTSKDISVGTTAISSLMMGQVMASLEKLPQLQSGEWSQHQVAVTMALFSGIIALGVSVLRLGILFNFICQPAIVGFLAGSGLTIVINQMYKVMGIPNIDTTEPPYLVFGKTLAALPQTHVDAAMGLLSLVWLYGFKYGCTYLTKRYPQHRSIFFYINVSRNVAIVVLTTFISWLVNHFGPYEESPFHILGEVPAGFQMMGVPQINTSMVSTLMSYLPSIVVLQVMEHCALATGLGKTSDYQIEVNQEILSIGIANIFGSFFSAYPATGSFCRSAIASKSGARTPFYNFFVGAIVLLSLYVFTPAFQFIPLSSLSAVIVAAVTDLIVGPQVWRRFWRLHPSELLIFAAAFIISLFTRLDISVYVPVGLSIIVQLYRTARPEYAMLGRVDLHDAKGDSQPTYVSFTHPTLAHCVRPIGHGVIAFQPRDNLVFENSLYLFGKLVEEVKNVTRSGQLPPAKKGDRNWSDTHDYAKDPEKPILRAVILDLSGVHQMDYTAAEELRVRAAQLTRFAGQDVHWYIVINDSLAVRKCLLFAGFGSQRPKKKAPGRFSSDLTPSPPPSNGCIDPEDEQEEEDDDLDTKESGEPQKSPGEHVVVIEDVRKKQQQQHARRMDVPAAHPGSMSTDTSSWSQPCIDCNDISGIDDEYPYLFYSMHDAVEAVLSDTHSNTEKSAPTPMSAIGELPNEENDVEKVGQ